MGEGGNFFGLPGEKGERERKGREIQDVLVSVRYACFLFLFCFCFVFGCILDAFWMHFECNLDALNLDVSIAN